MLRRKITPMREHYIVLGTLITQASNWLSVPDNFVPWRGNKNSKSKKGKNSE
jgi:hypothetical protein